LNRGKLPNARHRQTVEAPQNTAIRSKSPSGFAIASAIATYRLPGIGLKGGIQIGNGASAVATLHNHPESGRRIAVKHLSMTESRDKFLAEVGTMVKLNHPCVIRILGWSDSGHSTRREIHMEYAPNGTLRDLLDRARRGHPTLLGNPTGKAKAICNIVLGVRYVHSKGIVHRDLNPSNILFDEHWRPKIIDFGMSRAESEQGPVTADTGTVWYAAPEQLVSGGRHTATIDVFSFGYILYEILTLKTVFAFEEDARRVQQLILNREFPTLPDTFGSLMPGLLFRCWSENPSSRPSFEEIFREFKDCGFAILPDADSKAIKRSVDEVLGLELRRANRQT
jgi:serine/threonine protein kinase